MAPTDWLGAGTSVYYPNQHMNLTFYVEHRRWTGYSWATHPEWGYVVQQFPGQNPFHRGWGGICTL